MGLFEWLSIIFGASTVLLLVLLKDATTDCERNRREMERYRKMWDVAVGFKAPSEKTNWRDKVKK